VAKKKAETPKATKAVKVTDLTARDDSDVRQGRFCKVVGGEHDGRYGVYEGTSTYGDDGYPDEVVVITRDEDSMRIVVPYSSLVPSEAGHR
jgi:hypothetical protein